MHEVLHQLKGIGLVPVIKINDSAKAVPLAHALSEGGLPCAEVTFRTDAAARSIELMREACPDMVLGAGTVLTTDQVDRAVAAGAQFVVSPGFNPRIVDYCLAHDILVMPGVNSPSGVEQCLERGLSVVKFFPAESSGGLPFIKALAGPYADVLFMPTGGINLENLTAYTTCKNILACGGTWMVREGLVDGNRFDEIRAIAQDAVRAMLDLKVEGIEKGRVVISTIDLERAAFHLGLADSPDICLMAR